MKQDGTRGNETETRWNRMEQDETRLKQYETGWNKIQHDDVSVFMHKMNQRAKNTEKYIHDKQDEGYDLEKQDNRNK